MSSAWFSILINGSPKWIFPAQKGLREAFSRMVAKGRSGNLIKGFQPGSQAPVISHLQFADDTLLFCDAQEDQVKNIKAIHLCFEAVSRMKVNFF